MNNTTYTRRDVNSILDYLKEQARELSEGRWTDFSSGDIGSVLLGLMAYLADANNFQIDKAASELFLDTAVERSSLMALLRLVGYTPRHYQSAYTMVEMKTRTEYKGSTLLPKYTTFTNSEGTIEYTTLEDCQLVDGVGYVVAFEGTRVQHTFTYNQITTDGRIYLEDYKIGTNTVQLLIPSISSQFINQVEDVRFTDGQFVFSVHCDDFSAMYIQLPATWNQVLSESATITVSYLLTQGEAGRIGKNILTKVGRGTTLLNQYNITNIVESIGGFFPESAEDLKINGPRQARTMLTIVTKKDIEDLVQNMAEVASIKAGDYNDKWTGYKQPDDAYKCKVLAVPTNVAFTSLYDEKGEATPVLKTIVDYIDERRLASLMFTYEDPERIVPNIELNIYTNAEDLRTATIAENAKEFMKSVYSRASLGIGKSLYGSVIGRDLLNAFSEINYVEVKAPEHNIVCPENGYIDMYYAKFKIYVNDKIVLNEWN